MTSMISKFLISMLLLTCSLSAYSSIPDEFYVKQRWHSLTTTFDIETKELKLGTVHRKFFSLLPQYDFYNVHDVLQAKARMRFLAFGAVFDVVDFNDSPIGVVEEKFTLFFPTFRLISSTGEFLGEASLNFWGTKYTLKNQYSDAPVATLSRPFFRLKDDWTAKIHDKAYFDSKIDPRLFIVVMAFQTDRDYWKSLDTTNTSAFYINGSGDEAEQVNEEEVNQLLAELEAHTQMYTSFEPSEEDVEIIETLPEKYLIDDFNDSEKTTPIQGYQKLASLLNGEDLTPQQKNVLATMLSTHVKERYNKE